MSPHGDYIIDYIIIILLYNTLLISCKIVLNTGIHNVGLNACMGNRATMHRHLSLRMMDLLKAFDVVGHATPEC